MHFSWLPIVPWIFHIIYTVAVLQKISCTSAFSDFFHSYRCENLARCLIYYTRPFLLARYCSWVIYIRMDTRSAFKFFFQMPLSYFILYSNRIDALSTKLYLQHLSPRRYYRLASSSICSFSVKIWNRFYWFII